MIDEREYQLLTVNANETLFDALARIDANQRGFVIVVNDDGKVEGTLTDGDIRRAVLRGARNTLSIAESGAFRTNFTKLYSNQAIDDAIDIFKQGSITFLPVLNEEGRLVNVLLKKQLYSLILQCRMPTLEDDLTNVDENLVDFEVFNRPWGIYKTTVLQERYQSKVLQVRPLAKLSLQYHNHREEYWTVSSGQGVAQVGKSRFILHPGSHVVIPRGCIHRLENTSETDWLVVSEVQVGDYFGEDDIVRIEDEYGRVENGNA